MTVVTGFVETVSPPPSDDAYQNRRGYENYKS